MTALELSVDSDAWRYMTAEQRDLVSGWLRDHVGMDPNQIVGVRVVDEGVVEVEHFIDMQAGLFDKTFTTVHSPIAPPFLPAWHLVPSPARRL